MVAESAHFDSLAVDVQACREGRGRDEGRGQDEGRGRGGRAAAGVVDGPVLGSVRWREMPMVTFTASPLFTTVLRTVYKYGLRGAERREASASDCETLKRAPCRHNRQR